MWEYGFMLLDPSSTFESVRENLAFLRTILADGCLPVTFCRMLPYDGTPIKDELVRSGRLLGDVCNPDYDFLDPRLSAFYEALPDVVSLTGWIHGLEAVTAATRMRLARSGGHGAAVSAAAGHARVQTEAAPDHEAQQRTAAQRRRGSLLRVFGWPENPWDPADIERHRTRVIDDLLTARNEFVLRHQGTLLDALGVTEAPDATDDAEAVESMTEPLRIVVSGLCRPPVAT